MDSAEDASDSMYRAVLGFVADLYDVTEAGLTSADAKRLLETHHASPDSRDTLVKVLRACERRRYGGAPLSKNEIGALRQGAERAIEVLDQADGGVRR
jgi:hypothetical protein